MDAGGFGPGPGPTTDAGASLIDADVEPAPDAEPPASGFERITISQHQSDELGSGLGCVVSDGEGGPTLFTKQNHYYRVFDLSSHGITSDFVVEEVVIGISRSESDEGEQPVSIRLGPQADSSFPDPSGEDLETLGYIVRDGDARNVLFGGINAIIPAGDALYLEIEIPDGEPEGDEDGNIFFVALNEGGESAPTFFSSPDCGGLDLQTFSDHGFDRSWVVEVTGIHQP